MTQNRKPRLYILATAALVAACSPSTSRRNTEPLSANASNPPLQADTSIPRTSSSSPESPPPSPMRPVRPTTKRERAFLENAVRTYNQGGVLALKKIAPATEAVLLLDSWTGTLVAGHVYPSLRSLVQSELWQLMQEQHFPGQFEGSRWVIGSKRPPACRKYGVEGWYPRFSKVIAYGRLSQTDYFLKWDGAPIDYDNASSDLPKQYSETATHFVYSIDANLGLVFRLDAGKWRLLGIDALSPAC